jgi:alpha-glucosidase
MPAGSAARGGAPSPAVPSAWWRDCVCYEVYPRSFHDGDGDGIGDLPGAAGRLEYLSELGVDAVWITPFYPSPLADAGYDITDHTAVAPELGTMDDFDALAARAHALGLRLLIDLVPNHTSHTHPWFREAIASFPGSRARRRYVFRPGKGPDGEQPPNDWQSAFGGSAWTAVPGPGGRPGEWYLHLHASEQPDLNWRNQEVADDFGRILRFWLDHGVDGFRIDVAHALFKEPDLPDAGPGQHQDPSRNHLLPYYDRDELHPLFRKWRALLDRHPSQPGAAPPGERLLVAEAAVFDPGRLARYVGPGEMQQSFNFAFLECPWDGRAMRLVIEDSIAAMSAVDAPVTWVLSSHDAIRPVTRYGGGPAGQRRSRAAALLMLALPGAAYVFQGEELGLPQAELPDDRLRDPLWERSGRTDRGRDGCRVPLPWAGGRPPYGFSSAAPEDCWFPQPAHWAPLAVQAQHGDPASMLTLYRAALRIRKEHRPVTVGPIGLRGPDGASWLEFDRGPAMRCVVNFGPDALPLEEDAEILLSSSPLGTRTIPADTTVWIARRALP